MIVQFVLLNVVVKLSIASLRPTFSVNDDETLTVIFQTSPQVDRITFDYKYKNQGITHTTTANVQQNSAGYFKYDLEKEAPLIYSVQYFSNIGTLLYRQEGSFQPTIVPKHRIVRRGTTVLHDTFTTNHLDMKKWYHEITNWGGGNGEFNMYTPEHANTYIKNGELYLRPTFTADKFGENFLHSGTMDVKKEWGTCTKNYDGGCVKKGSEIPPIMSSKIYSRASIAYGRVEVVAKLPKGDWLWPAIWLLPPGSSSTWKYGGWPTSGEIDIMEARGNVDLKDHNGNTHGLDLVLSTIHWGTDSGHHKQAGHWLKKDNGNWGDGYHTYSLDWTADHIRMEVDNKPIFAWNTPSQGVFAYSHYSGHNPWAHGGKDAPFDGKFSLILNVAVGGKFFNDAWINVGHPKPWHGNYGNTMVDFWKNRRDWQPTWHGDDVAMKVRSVKMIQY